MGSFIIRDQAVYFEGFDLQARTKAVQIDYSAALLDATTLGNKSVVRLGGLKTIVFSCKGNMDADAADVAMFTDISGIDKPITASAVDDTEGTLAYFFKAGLADYKTGASVGEILPFELDADSSSGPLVNGTIMAQTRLTPATTSGNGTARALGAIASGKSLYSALHVWGLGTGTVTAIVESNSTNSFSGAQTARITHTATSAVLGEIKSLAGPITDTWWRTKYTISGASPSVKLINVLGFA